MPPCILPSKLSPIVNRPELVEAVSNLALDENPETVAQAVIDELARTTVCACEPSTVRQIRFRLFQYAVFRLTKQEINPVDYITTYTYRFDSVFKAGVFS